MTLVRWTLCTFVAAVVVATFPGCAAWSPSTTDVAYRGDPASRLRAADEPPTSGELVVRSQNPWQTEPTGAEYEPPGPNQVTPGSGGHFRYPMPVSDAATLPNQGTARGYSARPSATYQQTQLFQPITPDDPKSLWYPSSPSPGDRAGRAPANSGVISAPGNSAPSGPAASAPSGPSLLAAPPAQPSPGYGSTTIPPGTGLLPPPPVFPSPLGPGESIDPSDPTPYSGVIGLPSRLADIIVNVQETQTGRIMLGAGVNSDAGLVGQIVIDERNFDWQRYPRSIDDVLNGTAFRGAGQGFRLEAMPGNIVQRYLVQFTEPYLGGTRVSFSLSGYLYDRRFFDWDEKRVGGRLGVGYRLTPDLSLSVGLRGEKVDISDPRVLSVAALQEVLGENNLYVGQVSLIHDTRDVPFAPTEGHLLELTYSQAMGDFDYPRGDVDYRRYFLLSERPDGSGRHVLGATMRFGFSGAQTPLFEHYFAGGHATLRGFEFREASPKDRSVVVGGEFLMLGSLEYLFPITADDMLKGVVFADYGTVEENIEIKRENYRVSLGAGVRIFIPAMGPAPIALDFAVPFTRADTDRIENFSFFIGMGR